MKFNRNEIKNSEEGYVLIIVVVLSAVTLLISFFLLDAASSRATSGYRLGKHTEHYYNVEDTHGKVVAWLQTNSKNIVTAFTAGNYSTNFDDTAPSVGDNEGSNFSIATLVKMSGTNDTPMLSNNGFFGTATFPATTNIDTSASFDAVTEFANADLGGANARIVLVWARNTGVDYEPIFRIDVVNGNNPDRGVHSFSYVYSAFVSSNTGTAFYTDDQELKLNGSANNCDSYIWTHNGTSWSRGAPQANCNMATDATMTIKGAVSGSVFSNTNSSISVTGGGSVAGDVCEAAGCHVITMPAFSTVAAYCSGSSQGNLTISSDTSLSSGPNPSDQCWDTVTINNNRTLTLTDTVNPYYFATLNIAGNGSEITPGAIAPGDDLELYVDTFTDTSFNGNQMLNLSSAPHQFEVYYSGSTSLTANGNSEVRMFLVAPNAFIDVNGNLDFHGAIFANQIRIRGNATMNFDEAINAAGTPTVNDINFALRKASQRYR